jgi:hypothetical protein
LDGKKEENRKYSEIFNVINKNIYLILALMVFLGFFQIFIYYQNFDIGVYNYSSPLELLFYFIPAYIITPIKIVFKILNNLYFQILIVIYVIDLFLKEKSVMKRIFNYLKSLSNKTKKIFYYTISFYIIFILYFIIRLIYGLLSLEDLSDFDFYISNNFVNSNGYSNSWFQIMYLLWGVFIIVGIYRYIIKKENIKKFGNKASIFMISILIVLFVFESLKTTQRVASLKRHVPIQQIKFQYDTNEIKTDDSDFYIGSTRDYLFIRNLNSKENKLYNINNIKLLRTSFNKK